jgi:hypothetical protein
VRVVVRENNSVTAMWICSEGRRARFQESQLADRV